MNQERSKQVENVLNEYREKVQKSGEARPFMVGLRGLNANLNPEDIGYNISGIDRNSGTIKKLESLGFKAIYPAELSKEEISGMSDIDKVNYERKMKNALIIDGNEKNLSLEFASIISDHYLSADTLPKMWSHDKTMLSTNLASSHLEKGIAKNLNSLLSSIGFNPTLAGETITITSDIPYPTVKRSKFEQIYDKARGKIQGLFAKIKSVVKSKDQVKENEQEQEERE